MALELVSEPVPAKVTLPRVMMVVALPALLVPVRVRELVGLLTPKRYWLLFETMETGLARIAELLVPATSMNSLAVPLLMRIGFDKVTPPARSSCDPVTLRVMFPVPNALLVLAWRLVAVPAAMVPPV